MNTYRHIISFLSLISIMLMSGPHILAQVVTGKVVDGESGVPMEDVRVHNIHSGITIYTDTEGNFSISGKKDELIEIKYLGYKKVRIRLYDNPKKYLVVKLYIEPLEFEEHFVYYRNTDRFVDSVQNAETFGKQIKMPKIEGMDAIKHPLSYFSKHNRRVWEFQRRYHETEREKYIDHLFNDKVIQQLTNLGSDSLITYKTKFRPHAEWVTNWSNYQFLDYIKKSVRTFRNNSRYYNYKN